MIKLLNHANRYKKNYYRVPALLVTAAVVVVALVLSSCYKNDIEFGTQPENGYTRLIQIDSVTPQLSTVIMDSFITNNPDAFLVGDLSDTYLGKLNASPFFQLSSPATVPDIPDDAVYDSVCFNIKLNHYYYGDTTKSLTLGVHEITEAITYPYSSYIYNTSDFAVNPVALGEKTLLIRPSVTDSVLIRLNDTKGSELFTKLKTKSQDIESSDNFLNYFKGIKLSSGSSDTSSVYGVDATAGNMYLRVYYHHTIPYPEEKYVDFPSLNNSYSYNQLLIDRSQTLLSAAPATNGIIQEISSSLTGNTGFIQDNTGTYLKIIFPSLKGILQTSDSVKLLNAELIIRPVWLSFDRGGSRLPDSLYLATTDGSNSIGSTVTDSTGSSIQYASPVIDALYGENSYYRFNITSNIYSLLNTAGSADDGFMVLEKSPTGIFGINRAVIGDAKNEYTSELRLSVVSVKN